jgi:hypothetical protein
MDRDTPRPLSPEEAKARLRAAARELTLSHLIGGHPWRVLAVALAGGFVVGRLRIPAMTGTFLMQRIVPLMFTVWLRGGKSNK